jgi:hypothetical protein
MKIGLGWFIVPGLAVIAAWLVFSYLPGRPVRTRTVITMHKIAQILMDVDLLSGEGTEPSLLARVNGELARMSGEESLTINRKMAVLLKSTGDKDITAGRLVAGDGLFYDGWRRPLLFMHTNSVSYEQLNSVLRGKSRPIVIWSAGPNGTNEFGHGDDIFSGR